MPREATADERSSEAVLQSTEDNRGALPVMISFPTPYSACTHKKLTYSVGVIRNPLGAEFGEYPLVGPKPTLVSPTAKSPGMAATGIRVK